MPRVECVPLDSAWAVQPVPAPTRSTSRLVVIVADPAADATASRFSSGGAVVTHSV